MYTLRSLVSIAVILMSAFVAAFALLLSDDSRVEYTISKSRLIDSRFRAAAAFMDSQIQQTGKVPSQEDLDAWAKENPPPSFSMYLLIRSPNPYNSFSVKQGQAPENAYLLEYWRGEWDETYASWTRKSSLEFDKSAYSLFGSRPLQTAAGLGVSVLFLIAAYFIWPKKRNAA